jgi:hypothetical protein
VKTRLTDDTGRGAGSLQARPTLLKKKREPHMTAPPVRFHAAFRGARVDRMCCCAARYSRAKRGATQPPCPRWGADTKLKNARKD